MVDDQSLRHRVQNLIDGAPITPADDPLIDRWMQQIRLALLGRGARARDYTYRLNDIRWAAHADASLQETVARRVVPLLIEICASIDAGEFGREPAVTR